MSLAIERLSLGYEHAEVVSDVSLSVPPGGWLGLVGPNGAGKSTLLKAVDGLAGVVRLGGTISLNGEELSRKRRALARCVAYVPQRPVLPGAMTVTDYVLLGRSPHISYLGSETPADRRIAAEVIERLGLKELAFRALGRISGGEAQRAVLARALAQQAPVLLLDEPTAALDLGHQQRVLELVDELRRERGLTVVAAMHDLGLIGQFADAIALLVGGRLIATGTPKEVLTTAMIERHYDASVRLVPDGSGAALIVPVRRRPPARAPGTTPTGSR